MASHYDLNNLLVLIDRNNSLTLDKTENVIKLESLVNKITSFGFNVDQVDGHNYQKILNSLIKFKKNKSKKPTCIICNTIKGKGAKYIENNLKFHHAVPSASEYKKILSDLESNYAN